MTEIKSFKQKDLVLKVNQVFNPMELDYEAWLPFIERLCGDREYQKEAIKNAVLFLASKKYSSLQDLATENYINNPNLQEKYTSMNEYIKNLQLPDKLYADIDLATGTGKSYVIYGIAQILLGLGIVDRVLVLCPSLTIESGLKEKFEALSGDATLKKLIPEMAVIKNPSIITANETIKKGDLCIENIHAVYETTGSSISDSFKGSGQKVLVLNDESHHIFNKVSGSTAEDNNIKKWKNFLANPEYKFYYILGFTGTAYIEDEYFADVIYRYSLRDAIENHIVKNIDYVKEDDSVNNNEKFQKIYQNHKDNVDKYPLIKPLTILVTKDISKAKILQDDLIKFLVDKEKKPKSEVEKKALIVTSNREHRANIPKLKYVDEKTDPIEWIVSVSMLTEGWDVKNVFQIVPWEDRAFDSKLLVAQVLGRGLRIPLEYQAPQPKVIVFNHKSWSSKIKKLIDEVLEIETRISSNVLKAGERSIFNFNVYNVNYSNDPIEIESSTEKKTWNYSRLLAEGIAMESQSIVVEKGTTYDIAVGDDSRQKNYAIENATWTIDEILDKLFDEFDQREWEGTVLQLGENEYTKNNLPPREDIRKIIEMSMKKVGNKGDRVIEKNVHKILGTFSTFLRKKNKTVISQLKLNDIYAISTTKLEKQSSGVGNLRRGYSVFYTNNWENEITDSEQKAVLKQLVEDESLPRWALKETNQYLFKTPVDTVITSAEPERKFVEQLCKVENAKLITAWVKSRDRDFYDIDYSYRLGSKSSKTRKYAHNKFNPDFFILVEKDNVEYIIVVEIKADKDDSDENRAKYKYAVEHFIQLNSKLEQQGICQKYIFHFLSPEGYSTFFEHFRNGTMLDGQEKFRCEIERLLETNEE